MDEDAAMITSFICPALPDISRTFTFNILCPVLHMLELRVPSGGQCHFLLFLSLTVLFYTIRMPMVDRETK